MNAVYSDYTLRLNDLILEMFHVDLLKKNLADSHFFSSKIRITSFQLMDLICEIESVFSIRFDETDLISDNLYTLAHLSSLIEQKPRCTTAAA